ncbi:Dihydroflavonol 4-reductase, partial [Mucuna pruriens]
MSASTVADNGFGTIKDFGGKEGNGGSGEDGSTGYIGSWLVEALLQRGFTVHATVRDPVLYSLLG